MHNHKKIYSKKQIDVFQMINTISKQKNVDYLRFIVTLNKSVCTFILAITDCFLSKICTTEGDRNNVDFLASKTMCINFR